VFQLVLHVALLIGRLGGVFGRRRRIVGLHPFRFSRPTVG
jgi:hypothetical protein